ncbi:MAG: DUF116 domain-containing protein [Clostridia bacterium]|nr:DUF116 domain-containing protein [Clostridia bacterium]
MGLKALMPSVIYIAGIFSGNKDTIRQLYIELNNMIVRKSQNRKYKPEEILVILPHCLQNSDCGYKVAGDISKCKRCGRCCIGEIAKATEELGVKTEIVTGGTAARNIVNTKKPKVLLSVACERDLTSGISDISGIPVFGIINDRPNGPCIDTKVNTSLVISTLNNMLEQSKKVPQDELLH